MKKLALYIVVGVALLGCGGDDDPNSSSNPDSNPNPDTNPNPNPDPSIKLMPGFYTGTTSEGELVEGLVDDESILDFVYIEVDPVNGNEEGIGFIKSDGPVLLTNSKFTVSAKNYSYDTRPSRDVKITGEYKSPAIKGTIIELPSNPISYDLKLVTSATKKHTYSQINNKTITGPLYVTGNTGLTSATVEFTTNGNFTGNDSKGCNFSGKFTPAVSERYYVASVTFAQINCTAAGETLTGTSVLDDDVNNLIFSATKGNRGMTFGS